MISKLQHLKAPLPADAMQVDSVQPVIRSRQGVKEYPVPGLSTMAGVELVPLHAFGVRQPIA